MNVTPYWSVTCDECIGEGCDKCNWAGRIIINERREPRPFRAAVEYLKEVWREARAALAGKRRR